MGTFSGPIITASPPGANTPDWLRVAWSGCIVPGAQSVVGASNEHGLLVPGDQRGAMAHVGVALKALGPTAAEYYYELGVDPTARFFFAEGTYQMLRTGIVHPADGGLEHARTMRLKTTLNPPIAKPASAA